jgi:hypothetical protein
MDLVLGWLTLQETVTPFGRPFSHFPHRSTLNKKVQMLHHLSAVSHFHFLLLGVTYFYST